MRVLIADDHPMVRDAISVVVQRTFASAQLYEVESAEEAHEILVTPGDFDLVLLDLNIPGAGGFSTLAQIKSKHPAVPVMVVSGMEERSIVARALGHGAAAFVPKSGAWTALASALKHVVDGGKWVPEEYKGLTPSLSVDESNATAKVRELTPQQFRIASRLARGLLNKQIAYELGIAESTVKVHMAAVFRRLEVRNRTQVAVLMQQLSVEDLQEFGLTDET